MLRAERYRAITDFFKATMPAPETELAYTNPFELLVAVVLSAQCTDKRINIVTPALFRAFPDAAAMQHATVNQIFELIKSVSFPNNKAKHLVGLAHLLMANHNGEVPNTVVELTKLPGVGRKTANVIVSVVFNQPAMAVDTHVYRVSRRLGLANISAKTPALVEQALMKGFAKADMAQAHHWLILHGRYVCTARSPKCGICGLKHACRFFSRNSSNGILRPDAKPIPGLKKSAAGAYKKLVASQIPTSTSPTSV
jgi:endonuclease-3